MALTLVQRKKMQQVLILVLLVVLFITVTVLWLGFFKEAPVSLGEPKGFAGAQPQSVEINFSVLSLPLLEELEPPTESVQEPQLKGRNNPFLPF